MKKFLLFWSIPVFFFYFLIARDKAFFIRDDYNMLLVAKNFSFEKIFWPHNQHFIPVLRILYWLQFKFFGLDFNKYLSTQIFYHLIIVYLVFLILKSLIKNKIFAFLGALSFSLLGSSYKIFIMLASQQMAASSLFGVLALLFFLRSLKEKSLNSYIFSIFSALLSSFSMAVGLGALTAIFLLTLIFRPKNKKKIFLSALALFSSFLIYLIATKNSPILEAKTYFNSYYPFSMMQFIFTGIFIGTILEIFLPLAAFLRGLWLVNLIPQLIFILLSISFFFIVWKILEGLKSKRKYFLVFFIFVFCHFTIISFGRGLNLGYALSPQYTYFPKAVFIITIFFLLDIFWKKKSLFLPLILTFWIMTNQGLHFYYEIQRWQPRIVFMKNYFADLKYVFNKNKPVLNLYFPDSIAPTLKYSHMQKLIAPEQKIEFIEKEKIDISAHLEDLEKDQRAYKFYKKAIKGYDIRHY